MISASHNPYCDNGIKLLGPDGYKLSDEDELKIEALLGEDIPLAASKDIGRARRVEDARGRYIHAVKASFPADLRLDGLKIVVDCANGAAYQVAPSTLRSEEHTSELQSLMRISYAVFCLKKKNNIR